MKTTNLKLLPFEASSEELKLQHSDEVRNYKKEKEKLTIKDRLDLRNSVLYGEQVSSTLNATNSIASAIRKQKVETKNALLESLLDNKALDAERHAQAA